MVANTFATQLVVSTSKQSCAPITESNNGMALPPINLQSGNISEGPVAILWDIENCPVPSDVRPEDVAGNIRMALRVHPVIKGAVTMFSAYGDFNAFPRRLREGCQRTGVKLIDVPNGRKDAADKAILVDMFLFALDNRPPSFIMLISGDVDFAPALHILGQRGYTVILVIPSGVGVSSALSNAGRFVWDWPSVARGEGFVPSTWPTMSPCYGPSEVSGYLMGCHINENTDGHEEEAILYRGISQSCYNSKDFSIVSQSLSEYSSGNALALPCFSTNVRSQSLPLGIDEVTAGASASPDHTNVNSCVQPGDINVLKGQLVKLLELYGGCLPLARIPAEYQKLFGRPLYMSEYGALKLVNLLKKMSEVIALDKKGQNKSVYLKNTRAALNCPALASRRDKKGKGILEENRDNAGFGSSDELSDEERVVIEEPNKGAGSKTDSFSASLSEANNRELERFKYELQEILVSYSCRIFLSCFEEVYLQRYKRPLDYRRFGVLDLEELFNKVKDVVVLHEEPASKMKFVAALGC